MKSIMSCSKSHLLQFRMRHLSQTLKEQELKYRNSGLNVLFGISKICKKMWPTNVRMFIDAFLNACYFIKLC